MSIFGATAATIIPAVPASNLVTPWNNQSATGTVGSFYPPISIDGTRWNRLYPYRLLVVTQKSSSNQGGNQYTVFSSGGLSVNGVNSSFTAPSLFTAISSGVNSVVQATGKATSPSSGFSLTFTPTTSQWIFALPITPQQLQITTPYAISTIPTLRGIVEEHGGVRFKMINCSGTMGILPYKNSIGENLTSSIGGFFSGTIAAASNIVTQFNALKRAVGGSDGGVDVNSIPGGFAGTGYAQALLLDQFLEQYAEMKKNPANAACRLAFDIPKQNQTFLVTPLQFSWTQSIDSPGEIKYSFQLKAWKRISIQGQVLPNSPLPNVSPSVLQRIIKSIAAARSIVASAAAVIQAVNGDVMQVANVVTSLSLLVKSIGQLPQTAADMSINLIANLKSTLSAAAANLNGFGAIRGGGSLVVPAAVGSTVPVLGPVILNQSRSPADNFTAALNAVNQANAANGGLSVTATLSGQLGQQAAATQASSPANQVFSQPYLYPEFFDAIPISALTLTPVQQNAVNDYIEQGSLTDINDLLAYKVYLINLASLIANYYGQGNTTYAKVYRTPPANTGGQPMTIDQFAVLDALYDLIQSINLLTATQQIDDGRIQNSLGFAAQIATANGIPFGVATSKILAPVPFGLTIEQIAARYLGDANRWVEIATLNSLEEPYIDENGFVYPLLSNATGRFINVSTNENLYIGQTVILRAATTPSATRHIVSIEQINSTNFLITLDGNDNLDIYTTALQASMQAYLSGTVNSQGQIYIPSTFTPPDDIRTRPVPAFASDDLVGLSKIDWLISNGDIAIDAFGNFRLAGGLTNLIQALMLKFAQPWAVNLFHPTFGAGVGYGTSTADFDAQALYNQISAAILSDSRFGSIVRLVITDNGATLNIDLAVTIANGTGILPINFNINI